MCVFFNCGAFQLMALLLSFVTLTDDIKGWWIWGFWTSPMMYGQMAISVNEFLGKKWRHVSFLKLFALKVLDFFFVKQSSELFVVLLFFFLFFFSNRFYQTQRNLLELKS